MYDSIRGAPPSRGAGLSARGEAYCEQGLGGYVGEHDGHVRGVAVPVAEGLKGEDAVRAEEEAAAGEQEAGAGRAGAQADEGRGAQRGQQQAVQQPGEPEGLRDAPPEDALRTLVGMDEGAAMLGECALVPYESPIRESGILFYNTLFDENAACHLALGRGYSSNIRDYEKYSLDELRAMGVNDSMVHEDFMIGSAELDITGLTASGERLPIFRSGGWAF